MEARSKECQRDSASTNLPGCNSLASCHIVSHRTKNEDRPLQRIQSITIANREKLESYVIKLSLELLIRYFLDSCDESS